MLLSVQVNSLGLGTVEDASEAADGVILLDIMNKM